MTGDSHGRLLAPLQRFGKSPRYVVSSEPIEGPAGGWCDPKAKRIAVEASLPANAQLRTLIHETAHPLGSTPQRHSGPQAEVILDTVVSAPVARNRGSGAGLNG